MINLTLDKGLNVGHGHTVHAFINTRPHWGIVLYKDTRHGIANPYIVASVLRNHGTNKVFVGAHYPAFEAALNKLGRALVESYPINTDTLQRYTCRACGVSHDTAYLEDESPRCACGSHDIIQEGCAIQAESKALVEAGILLENAVLNKAANEGFEVIDTLNFCDFLADKTAPLFKQYRAANAADSSPDYHESFDDYIYSEHSGAILQQTIDLDYVGKAESLS
jgi:hypothetical protein